MSVSLLNQALGRMFVSDLNKEVAIVHINRFINQYFCTRALSYVVSGLSSVFL